MHSSRKIESLIKRCAHEAGFELAGIAPVRHLAELAYFPDWIAAGRAGEMKYLEARDEAGHLKRASLQAAAPWARSVVVCAINYNTAQPYSTQVHDAGRGWISRYAWSREDYHDSVMRRLRTVELHLRETVASMENAANVPAVSAQTRVHQLAISTQHSALRDQGKSDPNSAPKILSSAAQRAPACPDSVGAPLAVSSSNSKSAADTHRSEDIAPGLITRCYVDTGPLVERVYAKYAGVGWIGKNTCILNQKMGSWLFLGVILTSLDLAPDLPAPDRCGTCMRCIDACPTDALIAPYQLDSNLCISYLTIEKRGEIPEPMRAGLGRQVFGCDICQDVCPWNRKAPATDAEEFQPRESFVNPALAWLAEISAEEFQEKFRGSPIRRTKRKGLRRNAILAMGNSGNMEFLPLLEELTIDEDPVIAESASWARNQLVPAAEPNS